MAGLPQPFWTKQKAHQEPNMLNSGLSSAKSSPRPWKCCQRYYDLTTPSQIAA